MSFRIACVAALCLAWGPAFGWGDKGHEVIGLIADHYLEPKVRERLQSLLAADESSLTSHDIAHEATWADKYRDSDRRAGKQRYLGTRQWHFVDLELDGPNLESACFGRRALPAGVAASQGPAESCIVDKVDQFVLELKNPRTSAAERLLALQFLLHFVGDLHQPLHAADDRDEGGNRKFVSADDLPDSNLHHAWDTSFVELLGPNENAIAERLLAGISAEKRSRWASGTPADWAMESFSSAKLHAYGLLPIADAPNHYELAPAYVTDALVVTAQQLSKAGVRLAYLLNRALE